MDLSGGGSKRRGNFTQAGSWVGGWRILEPSSSAEAVCGSWVLVAGWRILEPSSSGPADTEGMGAF